MEENVKKKFPEWCGDTETNYKLLITNDIDSLMCYTYQRNEFNRECEYFYDHDYSKTEQAIYMRNRQDVSDILCLDCAIENDKFKCWDNHIVKVNKDDTYNSSSANLNIIKNIGQANYTKKACVSSYITMLSYYDEDLSLWTNEMKAVICAIDGLYHPFLPSKRCFRETAKENLRMLGYEYLIEFMDNNMELIERIENELNLKYGKIHVDDNMQLYTDIDLEGLSSIFGYKIKLPDVQFKENTILQKHYINNIKEKPKDCFNFALNFKNSAIYSKF